ncbi:hypothetical protein [Campylobacter californiensis]|uniref:hypothetical protein n=1 Tax=Campylobacter californiensis TaxID=1032243 RepID=UPI001D13E29D|nr:MULTISPECIES: hypothetical protein [unclassified Campylobacter]
MIELSNKNKIIAGENIIDTFQAWFDERINSLIRVSEFVESSNLLSDSNKTNEFLKIFAKNSKEFDVVQLQAKSGDIWVDGKMLPSYDRQAIRADLIWYA